MNQPRWTLSSTEQRKILHSLTKLHHMWWLFNNLIEPNENHSLKLTWTWEPIGSSKSLRFAQEGRFRYLFFQETKVKASFFEFWKSYFRFYGCLTIDCIGKGWGLVLLWKREVDFEVLSFSSSIIHGRVREKEVNGTDWFFSSVYRCPKVEKHGEF